MAVAGAFLGPLVAIVVWPVLRYVALVWDEWGGLGLLLASMSGGMCCGAVILPLAAASRPPRWLRERLRHAAHGLLWGVAGLVAVIAALWVATRVWDEVLNSRFLLVLLEVAQSLPLLGMVTGFAWTSRRR